jgi:hypothetical protein
MTDWSNVTDLEIIIKIMIRIGSLCQRYASVCLTFKIQIGITSYLRAIVSTTENIVEIIYQRDNIFPSNLQAIYLCINYISDKNKTL